MAKIISRTWKSAVPLGRKVRHTAYGYQLVLPTGQRERKFSSAWQSEADARKALVERLEQLDHEANQIEAAKEEPPAVTFAEAAERYLQLKADEGKRSLRDDARVVRQQLLPFFGATTLLQDVSKERVSAFRERRIKEVSVYTTRNELSILRHLLRLAREDWGYLDTVPAVRLPKAPEGRLRFLDGPEIARFVHVCGRSRNRHLMALVTLAINTGMRRGEIMGLTWERVYLDPEGGGVNARIVLHRTKSGKPRGVPLNTAAIAALASIEPDAAKREGRVFKRRDGSDQASMRKAFDTAVKRADLHNFRFHDLRHTFGSHMSMRGRPLKEIQECLGHSTIEMTMRYSHLSPAHLRTAVESLQGLTPELDQMAQEMAQSTVSNDHQEPTAAQLIEKPTTPP
jgi:integrase